jgi:hypothetical protein
MAQNLTDLKFGRLTVIERTENTPQNRAQWLCMCECGGAKIAQAAYLKSGSTKSCGCLGIEQRQKNARNKATTYSRSVMGRERKSWESMLARCYVPTTRGYGNYGGIGISVCDRWRDSFKDFVGDMGRRPPNTTIDRIDNSKNYTLDNCRWASRIEQANNRSTNRIITIDGVSLSVANWARKQGISHFVIYTRLHNGINEHDAVMTPVKSKHYK